MCERSVSDVAFYSVDQRKASKAVASNNNNNKHKEKKNGRNLPSETIFHLNKKKRPLCLCCYYFGIIIINSLHVCFTYDANEYDGSWLLCRCGVLLSSRRLSSIQTDRDCARDGVRIGSELWMR